MVSKQTLVSIFQLFPFEKGQKVHIKSGPRRGDWEVVNVTERKVKLRCPVSLREFEWDLFCYYVEEKEQEWPQKD